MDATIAAIALNGIGVGLGMWAWRGRRGMDGGPRLLLDFSLFLAGIALLCAVVALMLDYPESRGVFAVIALAALGLAAARSVRARRRAAQTVQATAAEPEPDQLRRVPLSAFGTFIPADDAGRSARAQAAMRKAVSA